MVLEVARRICSPSHPSLSLREHRTTLDQIIYSAHIYPSSNVLYHSSLGHDSVDELGGRNVEGRAGRTETRRVNERLLVVPGSSKKKSKGKTTTHL